MTEGMLAILAGLASAEAAAATLVAWLRPGCKWLITARDLDPPIDRAGLDRFLEHGWDADLGWVRKPGTTHREAGQGGIITSYTIGTDGARHNPNFDNQPVKVTVWGDSYAFARQVNDDETWSHGLSQALAGNVQNFGVGNYGLDQALLRLERDWRQTPLAIMAVVPETISRCLSVWKHFSEYGNIFAFKPRFHLSNHRLHLMPNPIRTPQDFLRIGELLPSLKRDDVFWERKFKPDLLGFPWSLRLLARPQRHLPLIAAALADRIVGGEHAFTQIMQRNITLTASLYREAEPVDLLEALCLRFRDQAYERGARAIVVMLPQLLDLARIRAGDHYYAPFLRRLADHMPVADMAPALLAAGDERPLYIHDSYGGHLSALGNRIIADTLAPLCRVLATDSPLGI